MRQTTAALQIEMAPMQGLTGHVFRAVYLRHFAGVDRSYCPFVRLKAGQLPARDARELDAGVAAGEDFTAQIVAGNPAEAIALCELLVHRGLRRVNLNLGCPYPMETRRHRGAGVLPYPTEVEQLLETLCSFAPALTVSVKTRLGLERVEEFAALVPVFERFPLQALIVHPRTARQMYTGAPDWAAFGRYTRQLSIPVLANGDILTVEDARRVREACPWIAGWMIGRGLLRDPFLPAAIRGDPRPAARLEVLRRFHEDLVRSHRETGLSEGHTVDRMRQLWPYLAHSFAEPEKLAKKFKKARTPARYQQLVDALFG